MSELKIKCNNCGYTGPESEFPTGRDFFQNKYVKHCPKKCGNRQGPGGASMRMMGGGRPFEYIRGGEPDDAVSKVMHRANEAS